MAADVRISETGFRILLSSAALLLTDQNEFSDFSVTGRPLTWCHNFENFDPHITACYRERERERETEKEQDRVFSATEVDQLELLGRIFC